MVWVIIGCTILIIVCLGGGMRLAQIIIGAIAIFGAAIFLGSDAKSNIDFSSVTTSGVVVVIFMVVFFALMAYRQAKVVPRALDSARHTEPINLVVPSDAAIDNRGLWTAPPKGPPA